jgi:GNAT superfamily N-acetyltransferase
MPANDPMIVRHAVPDDCPLICDLIYELADYERLTDEVRITPDRLNRSLFGGARCADALIGEIAGEAAGYALFFTTFSTFTGQPGLYLEDIYVRSQWRNRGLGKAMLAQLARIAVQRGCARLEWAVLDWNQPAIDFYRNLGAQALSQWIGQRLAGEELTRLAAHSDR